MKIKGSKNKIVCEGDFIFDNAEAIQKGLVEKLEKIQEGKPAIFDLSLIKEIDSSGLQLLLSLFKTLEKRKIQYKVTEINDSLLELLTLSGLDKFFKLEV